MRAVLDKVAQVGNWGRAMPAGTAQGIGSPQRVQGLRRLPGRDRLPAGDRQPQGRARLHRAARDEGRVRGRRRPADQPARPRGPDDGRDHGRDRPGAHLQPAPQGRPLPRGQLGRRLLHAAVEHAAGRRRSSSCRRRPTSPGGAGEFAVAPSMAATACAYARATGTLPTSFPINHNRADLGFTPFPTVPPVPAVAHRRPDEDLLRSARATAHVHPQRQAGQRRLPGRRPPAVGAARPARRPRARSTAAALGVCQACTSHINGKAFNPCSVPVSQIKPTDKITTIEGLRRDGRQAAAPGAGGVARQRRRAVRLLPARPDHGRRRPRSSRSRRRAAAITDADLDEIRNVCRCGTYPRIREAIKAAAAKM